MALECKNCCYYGFTEGVEYEHCCFREWGHDDYEVAPCDEEEVNPGYEEY